jgi:hypothetical protein
MAQPTEETQLDDREHQAGGDAGRDRISEP